MKLLANENIPLASYKYLIEVGYDIIHVGEVNPSILDQEVMELAIRESRIIITFDRDYGTLIFKQGFKPLGVIYLRLSGYSPIFPGKFIETLLQINSFEFIGNFTVASEENIRQRKIS